MLIVMKADATEGQVKAVLRVIEQLGYRGHPMPGASRTAIGITGNPGAVDPSHFENLPALPEAVRVSKPYKLVTLDFRSEKTVVQVGDASIGGEELAIIAVAQSKAATRRLSSPEPFAAVARSFSAAALLNREPLLTLSRVSAKTD